LTNADSWLKSFRPRKDKLAPRPLPFDVELKPKHAFAAMLASIQAASAESRPKL
jgi:GH35 family endo-1,4-beta-xylanase